MTHDRLLCPLLLSDKIGQIYRSSDIPVRIVTCCRSMVIGLILKPLLYKSSFLFKNSRPSQENILLYGGTEPIAFG